MSNSSDKDKIIEFQGELSKKLHTKIKEWEALEARSKQRHAKGRAKADLAISKNKNMLGLKTTLNPKK